MQRKRSALGQKRTSKIGMVAAANDPTATSAANFGVTQNAAGTAVTAALQRGSRTIPIVFVRQFPI
jgi:hypothetical protein